MKAKMYDAHQGQGHNHAFKRAALEYMSCYQYATRCQCGDILIEVKHMTEKVKHMTEQCGFTLYQLLFALPSIHPSFILLSPAPAHLSVSGPHRLVVRVVGCPWPKALIGVEIHGVDFIPANVL